MDDYAAFPIFIGGMVAVIITAIIVGANSESNEDAQFTDCVSKSPDSCACLAIKNSDVAKECYESKKGAP